MTSISDKDWDVIVIGTGMGGGTIGRRLAELGKSVLFLERGPNGIRAEEHELRADVHDKQARLVRGFLPEPMHATVDGVETVFYAPLGCGVGGSSVFYAATLERPEPHDLDACPEIPHPTGGWPVSYAEMRPYFEEAERLFHVCGNADPLGDPVDLPTGAQTTAVDAYLTETMRKGGLHPYQGHLALQHLDACTYCLGSKCPRDCKMDGRSAGVEPALATGRAQLFDLCEVRSLNSEHGKITSIDVYYQGHSISLKARAYVLSAGALCSPRLLMASGDLANGSGQVGRNLMFHLSEIFALWPGLKHKGSAPSKALAFRDLYHDGATRFGMVQAMGIQARYGEIVHYLNMRFDRSRLRHIAPLRQLTRLVAAIATQLLGEAKIFVGILEDLPDSENRVLYDQKQPEKLAITYNISRELQSRRKVFRQKIKQSINRLRPIFLGRGPDINYGHPCGTLRFGNDPTSSVLNRDCRAHQLENLWVVDASFMPTSMGVNPSLTIAANALRVGDVLAETLEQDSAL